jgi:hypothetical protein
MLKDLIKFFKLKYGRVVMVPYWVDQSPSQEVFPKKTYSDSCNEYDVDGGMNFGHGVLNISKDRIVSFMGTFVEGVLHPLFTMQPFSKSFYLPLIYYGPKH